jgi:putative ABC transport system permease protein
MKAWRLALRSWTRGLRAGRLTVLMVALTVAVAAITSIGFFIDRVRASVEREAAGVLAADLRISANDPLSPEYLAEAERRGLATAELASLATVIMAGEASQLASLYAVSDAYPLRGQVRVADAIDASDYPVTGGPAPGRIWAEAGLLARLGADVGDRVSVGAVELAVERVLKHRPDQTLGFDTFAPSVLINLADLEATDLIRPGSRVSWAQLFAGEAASVSQFSDWLSESREPSQRVQTAGRAEDRIQRSIDRAESFLSLASMIALLLAATAVAVSARRYAVTQVDGVALMKCLGAKQSLVLAATLIELGIMGLTTGLAGSGLGYLAQLGLGTLVSDLMEVELPAPGLGPAVSGVLTALAVLAGFALPAMLTLRTVPPLRVLRHDAAPKPLPTVVSYGAAAAAVIALLVGLVGADELLVVSVVGLGVGAALLFVSAWALVKLIGPLRHGAGVAWRYGIANIARRRGDSIAQVMAFGFGLSVLLLLSLVRTDLLDAWYTSLPEDTPNHFMINIQRHETDGIREVFEEFGYEAPQLVPMVRGRLVDVIRAAPISDDFRRRGGWLRREANLTWAQNLDPSNEIVEGEWWTPDTERAEISVEEDIARGMGLSLGDRLIFDVGGVELTAVLTSIRRVEWDSLSPNFMLVFNPVALEDAPASFLASIYAADRQVMLELAHRFPSVTVIDLESVLDQVRSVMDRAALAIEYVFLFTLLAGVLVLLAAVQATREERRFEVALLRTLGANRRRVLMGLITEFVSLGLLAGLLASLIATGVAYLLATRAFGLEFSPNPTLIGIGLVAGALLVGISGVLATYSVVRQPPMGVLAQAS